MKYNLKNRPKDVFNHWKRTEKWFERFEKELRDIADGKTKIVDGVPVIAIEEILGES